MRPLLILLLVFTLLSTNEAKSIKVLVLREDRSFEEKLRTLIRDEEARADAGTDYMDVTSDKLRYLNGLLRNFANDLLGQMKVILSAVDVVKKGGQQWKVAKEAKSSADKLYRSVGDLLELFKDKNKLIDVSSLNKQDKESLIHHTEKVLNYLGHLQWALHFGIKLEKNVKDLPAQIKTPLIKLLNLGRKDYGNLEEVVDEYFISLLLGENPGNYSKEAVKALQGLRKHFQKLSELFGKGGNHDHDAAKEKPNGEIGGEKTEVEKWIEKEEEREEKEMTKDKRTLEKKDDEELNFIDEKDDKNNANNKEKNSEIDHESEVAGVNATDEDYDEDDDYKEDDDDDDYRDGDDDVVVDDDEEEEEKDDEEEEKDGEEEDEEENNDLNGNDDNDESIFDGEDEDYDNKESEEDDGGDVDENNDSDYDDDSDEDKKGEKEMSGKESKKLLPERVATTNGKPNGEY